MYTNRDMVHKCGTYDFITSSFISSAAKILVETLMAYDSLAKICYTALKSTQT